MLSETGVRNYYYYYNHFMTLCLGLPGWAGTRKNIHKLTYPDHHQTFISFLWPRCV